MVCTVQLAEPKSKTHCQEGCWHGVRTMLQYACMFGSDFEVDLSPSVRVSAPQTLCGPSVLVELRAQLQAVQQAARPNRLHAVFRVR